jgi:DNA-binding CsgD family transcriptional regulator
MNNPITFLIAQFEECNSSHDVWQVFLDFITSEKFIFASYAYNYAPINEPLLCEDKKTSHLRFAHADRTWITNLPEQAFEEYKTHQYEKDDPMLAHVAAHSLRPLYLSRCQLDRKAENFARIDYLLERAEHFGIYSSVGFPLLHVQGRGYGHIILHCADRFQKLEKITTEHGDKLHLACLYMHMFYQPFERTERAATYGIKGRPMQVLKLLRAGLTNNQIAERLEVSAPTVSFHIKELRDSLRVTSTREILPTALNIRILAD